MAKALKITKEDVYKMERAARRNTEIELQLPRVKHSVHKSKKDYNRQQSKKIVFNKKKSTKKFGTFIFYSYLCPINQSKINQNERNGNNA